MKSSCQANAHNRRRLIMLIDDAPEDRLIFQSYLRHDYDVASFESGNAALVALEDDPLPDLILLDLFMQGLNGFDVIDRLRHDSRTCKIPVIFVTASDELADEHLGLSLGAIDYVTKPVQPPLLMARIRNHLSLADAQSQLAEANCELESRIAERTRHLERALVDAESGRRTQQEFMANISHEIRTPMNGILGMSSLLMSTSLGEEQQDMVAALHDSAKDLMTTLGRILDFAAVSGGSAMADSEPFEIRSVIQSVEQAFLARAAQKRIDFSCHVDQAVPAILIGRWEQIRLIAHNLVDNALKFSERGLIGLRIMLAGTAGETATVALLVSDTGCGIEPDKLDHIFEPFAQADGSSTRRYGGVGLGLAIVRQHVELMNGSINIRSTPGEGTLVTLHLPLQLSAGLSRGRCYVS